jgi:hypothetical protein
MLTLLVTGVLVVALGAPAYADFEKAPGSTDDQITAMRHRGDWDDGGRGYRRGRHRHHDDDHRYYRHRHRHRHYHRYYGHPYYYGRPYYYGGYYGHPAYYRRSHSRARECYDAYYHDRYFYDRYCRGWY